jgi:hypothetical protein
MDSLRSVRRLAPSPFTPILTRGETAQRILYITAQRILYIRELLKAGTLPQIPAERWRGLLFALKPTGECRSVRALSLIV